MNWGKHELKILWPKLTDLECYWNNTVLLLWQHTQLDISELKMSLYCNHLLGRHSPETKCRHQVVHLIQTKCPWSKMLYCLFKRSPSVSERFYISICPSVWFLTTNLNFITYLTIVSSLKSNIRWNPWRILNEIHGHLILEEFQQKSNIRIPWSSNSWRIS